MFFCGCLKIVMDLLSIFVLLQAMVAEHDIQNISCAAQDPDDLCTFAYITKDLKSGYHFCHVFTTVEVVGVIFIQGCRWGGTFLETFHGNLIWEYSKWEFIEIYGN